ncbi:hypothetical protein HanXRQr2_Chr14g0664681 [Helianthus annuus]|uniref:Uncharacterized protein n=1 Tax=Helianthus annuus TaxID=4232 RepID=A0A9K3EBL8_HELAN|nr:hypothetical protein HanXRQr2_Chr14g0664681 [Helianthus annuus]KAJ0842106.1 hypothetical protein HanPSC8_Chr14g0637911 [Helianthus annuus]
MVGRKPLNFLCNFHIFFVTPSEITNHDCTSTLWSLTLSNTTTSRSHLPSVTNIFVAIMFPTRFFSTTIPPFLQFLKLFQHIDQLISSRSALWFSRETLHCKNCSSRCYFRRVLTDDPLVHYVKNPSFACQIRPSIVYQHLFVRWTVFVNASSSCHDFKKNHPKTVDVASFMTLTNHSW